MSTAAILKYPDFFKVAVSCAGNHDNSIYNRWWSEQHHGVQEKVSQGDTTFVYHIDTNQEIASRLKGHLLLVHGDIDNNVNPANSIRVVDALIRANKRFDMLILPGQRHGFGDMNEYFFWKWPTTTPSISWATGLPVPSTLKSSTTTELTQKGIK